MHAIFHAFRWLRRTNIAIFSLSVGAYDYSRVWSIRLAVLGVHISIGFNDGYWLFLEVATWGWNEKGRHWNFFRKE